MQTLVIAVLCAITFLACTPSEKPTTSITEHQSGDQSTCVNCHADQVNSWQTSHHHKAISVASSQTVQGDFDSVTVVWHGQDVVFTKSPAGYFIATKSVDGTHDQHRVAYTFGVEPLQQYIVEFPNGHYQVFPIAWHSENKYWFDAETSSQNSFDDELHWTQPLHNWNYMCAECHATDVKRGYDSDKHTYQTTATRFDVGCASCHGTPVRSAMQTQTQQLEVCATCHARRAPISDGHSLDASLHDDYLVDLIMEPVYYDDGQIKEESYEYGSFLQSRMHEVGMVCTDCHDPHSGSTRKLGNALCTTCHSSSPQAPSKLVDASSLQRRNYDSPEHHFHSMNSAGSQCVSCHAPTRYFMQVDARHDHSFRIPRPDLSVTFGVPNACTGCHTDKSATWALNELKTRNKNTTFTSSREERRRLFTEGMRRARQSTTSSASSLPQIISNRSYPTILRASALAAAENRGDLSVKKSAIDALRDTDPLVRKAAVNYINTVVEDRSVRALLRDALRDEVKSVRLAAIVGLPFVESDSNYNAVRKEYVSTQHSIGGQGNGSMNLGVLHYNEGDLANAERWFKNALRENPFALPAIINLADVVRLRDEQEAQTILRSGIARLPRSAELYYSLALSEIRSKRYDKAELSLKAAIRLDNTNADYREILLMLQQNQAH